jgi:hypothetical protein
MTTIVNRRTRIRITSAVTGVQILTKWSDLHFVPTANTKYSMCGVWTKKLASNVSMLLLFGYFTPRQSTGRTVVELYPEPYLFIGLNLLLTTVHDYVGAQRDKKSFAKTRSTPGSIVMIRFRNSPLFFPLLKALSFVPVVGRVAVW